MINTKTSILLILLLFLACSKNNSIIMQEETNYLRQGLNTNGEHNKLDILTWNIEFFPKHELTIPYVKESIDALNVDIIALQEITSTDALNNLSNLLGENWISFRSGPANSTYAELSFLINNEAIQYANEPQTILNWAASGPGNAFSYRAPFMFEFVYNNSVFYLINIHLKCCGDGIINPSNIYDEEYRRQEASRLLHEYINENLSGENVIVMGDFNDELTDIADYNVFNIFLADVDNYLFADFEIAIGNNENWSYPLYGNDGSHIDHILITNELFNNISNVETLLMGSSLSGGFGEYNYFISDHRPMILSLDIGE